MKEKIEGLVNSFILDYSNQQGLEIKWKAPIFAYANGKDPMFEELKKYVSETHLLPEDLLWDVRTVIAYFLPFEDNIVNSNKLGRIGSPEWALAYIETNKIIEEINQYLKESLVREGYRIETIPATHNFDTERLMSDWSHRHVAYIAGLGKFGLNNMLITQKGCCGRIGTLVTNINIAPTIREEKENCLYKYNGSCKKCIDRCVNNALTIDGFNRHKCYEMCLINSEVYKDLGLADICGKCLIELPCSIRNPVK